jgi:hypothetical protein
VALVNKLPPVTGISDADQPILLLVVWPASIRVKQILLIDNGTVSCDYDPASKLAVGVAGDYNNSGVANAAEYTLW